MPEPKAISDLETWRSWVVGFYRRHGILRSGLIVFALIVFFAWWNWSSIETRPGIKQIVQWIQGSPKPDATSSQADVLFAQAEKERLASQNDAARATYGKALALYHEEGNQRGQANVQLGTADLDRELGNSDAARTAYGKAVELYLAVGRMSQSQKVQAILRDLPGKP